MFLIAHISDLHISNSTFNEEIFFEAVNQINELNPDIILLTGDITNNGYYSEFNKAIDYLNMFNSPLFAVPGNHDSRNLGFEAFENFLGKLNWVLNKFNELIIIGLDSSDPDLDRGHIGRPQQYWMEKELNKSFNNSKLSIVSMHHHVIPVPKTGRERNVLSDAGDILKSLIDCNVNIVLSGHKHVSNLWKVENTLFINAGSTSSIKLRGNDVNSYNIYKITDDYIEANLNQVRGNSISLGNFKR